MTNPYGIGKLPYPLSYRTNIEQDSNYTVEIGDNSALSACNWFVVSLTPDEQLQFTSALLAGLDLLYPDNFIDLFAKFWLAPTEFPNGIPSDSCMDLCELIANCIATNQNVIDAINNVVTSTTQETLLDNVQGQANDILGDGGNPTCDYDMLWGAIDNVIDQANVNNIDAIEILETITNSNELIAQLSGSAKGRSAAMLSSLLAWITWAQNNIAENYNAQITTAYLNTLKCDLFCLSKDDCILTPQIITDYFYERLASVLEYGSVFIDTVNFLVSGTWTGTEIADVMMLSQFAFRAQVGYWLGEVGFITLDQDMRLGFLNPSDDWTVLCDTCPVNWTYQWDFTVSDGGFYATSFAAFPPPVNTQYGLYVASTGWGSASSGTHRNDVYINKALDTAIDGVKTMTVITSIAPSLQAANGVTQSDGTGKVENFFSPVPTTRFTDFVALFGAPIDDVKHVAQTLSRSPGQVYAGYVTSITITGYSPIPLSLTGGSFV